MALVARARHEVAKSKGIIPDLHRGVARLGIAGFLHDQELVERAVRALDRRAADRLTSRQNTADQVGILELGGERLDTRQRRIPIAKARQHGHDGSAVLWRWQGHNAEMRFEWPRKAFEPFAQGVT
jgi:hypothetical protein